MVAVRGRPTLVRICDLAGRPRGAGVPVDDLGTLVTTHEAVEGLGRAVVHAPCGRTFVAGSGDITPVPEWNLALVRTEGLASVPWVIAAERPRPGGAVDVLTPDGPLRTAVTGTTAVTYTSTDRYHPLQQVLQLDLPEAVRVQLRLSRPASGAPVVDAGTGAVLALLGTALHAPDRSCGFAVPLYAAGVLAPDGPLAAVLRRNGATVPGFGPDLNLAGALHLAATSAGPAVERCARAVDRPEVARELDAFGRGPASVLALVGEPGTGRTTELAALAARRAQGPEPAPTVWLRGAELRAEDDSVREAVGRTLAAAGRIVAASQQGAGAGVLVGEPGGANPDVVARLARLAGRPLLVVLDAPEEMPPQLAHRLRRWAAGTASWLRACGARMALACRPEFWERAGALLPPEMLYGPAAGPGQELPGRGVGEQKGEEPSVPEPAGRPVSGGGVPGGPGLPGCVRLGGLTGPQAARARAVHGVAEGALRPGDDGHPLVLRMAGAVRAAQGGAAPEGGAAAGAPRRAEVFSAHLDLLSLRIAERLVGGGRAPGEVRRLAARVCGQVHEAARRSLGPGLGQLDRAVFEELFPWNGGWASAVLAEGLLAPAGDGYRFADEEFADWLQGAHLELDGALDALVHHRSTATVVPVPRHRIGPVVQALLLCDARDGSQMLAPRLRRLVDRLAEGRRAPAEAAPGDEHGTGAGTERDGDGHENGDKNGDKNGDGEDVRAGSLWWAAHLLGETLLRVPDARPYLRVLHALAERVADPAGDDAPRSGFGPWFWRALPLRPAEKAELLRVLLPADPPYTGASGGAERCLDVLAALLRDEPRALQPLLCEWFDDTRPLRERTDGPAVPGRNGGAERSGARSGSRAVPGAARPTVADAAQALLYTHRGGAVDELAEALVRAAHPRADALLAELVPEEPSALCRAVERWARDPREGRRVAAAVYGPRLARRVRGEEERALLRRAALFLLRGSADGSLHDCALALLVRDPVSRGHHLDRALARFAVSGHGELAVALGLASATHPEPVFDAFRAVLLAAPEGGEDVSPAVQQQTLRALAEVGTPAPARRAAALAGEYAARCPGRAREAVAAFVRRRPVRGPAARAVLRPMVTELLRDQRVPFRAGLARELGRGAGPVRDELLDLLLVTERELPVLREALRAVVHTLADGRTAATAATADAPDTADRAGTTGTTRGPEAVGEARAGRWGDGRLVCRIGQRMACRAEGAAPFDQELTALAGELPGLGAAVRAWAAGAPGEWAALAGPGIRRLLGTGPSESVPEAGTPAGAAVGSAEA